VKFAIVQADVYQAFVDRAASGNKDVMELMRPLRVILRCITLKFTTSFVPIRA
jgi:hypothetical protein